MRGKYVSVCYDTKRGTSLVRGTDSVREILSLELLGTSSGELFIIVLSIPSFTIKINCPS